MLEGEISLAFIDGVSGSTAGRDRHAAPDGRHAPDPHAGGPPRPADRGVLRLYGGDAGPDLIAEFSDEIRLTGGLTPAGSASICR